MNMYFDKLLTHSSFSCIEISQFVKEKSPFCAHITHTKASFGLNSKRQRVYGKSNHSRVFFFKFLFYHEFLSILVKFALGSIFVVFRYLFYSLVSNGSDCKICFFPLWFWFLFVVFSSPSLLWFCQYVI